MCHFRGRISFCLLWAHYLSFSCMTTVLSDLSHARYNFPDILEWVGISHYQSTIYAEITFILAGMGGIDIKQKDLNQASGAVLPHRIGVRSENSTESRKGIEKAQRPPNFLSLTAGC